MKKITTSQLVIIALAGLVNILLGNIALFLHIPFIYFDAVGTIFIAAFYGPIIGMIPGMISNIILGATTDIYSFYFLPVQLVLGFFAGLTWKKFHLFDQKNTVKTLLAALCITLPSTVVSSFIAAKLFGGVTSSGSSILVQLLHKSGWGIVPSVFFVQFLSDYCDRLISILLVRYCIRRIPPQLRERFDLS